MCLRVQSDRQVRKVSVKDVLVVPATGKIIGTTTREVS